ncbi:MAG: hypothetical protein FJX77_13025 [Armatimonadetes bacterium]|nr:hypothetical protein [Armatimonadota bacterium]
MESCTQAGRLEEREVNALQILGRRGVGDVGPAADAHPGRALGAGQGGEHGLGDQGSRTRRADVKLVLPGLDRRLRLKRKLKRSDCVAPECSIADSGRRPHRGQMLGLESRLLSPGPDPRHRHRLAGQCRQRDGRADDLTASFPKRSIYLNQRRYPLSACPSNRLLYRWYHLGRADAIRTRHCLQEGKTRSAGQQEAATDPRGPFGAVAFVRPNPMLDQNRFPPGTIVESRLPVMDLPDGTELALPLLVCTGARPGPRLALLAGVHGDEYEGIRAIPEVLRSLDPGQLIGTIWAVPVCNVPAYHAATRCSPLDGLNLARVFPGNPNGTVTERIAAVLTDQILREATFLLDLHSAGIAYSMPTLVGYPHEETPSGRVAREAALAFGAPVVWGHPPDPTATGRTVTTASELGIPWLYTEAPGAARVRAEDLCCFRAGIENLLHYLGMLPGGPRLHPAPLCLLGGGNLDRVPRASVSGYFVPTVELLERVEPGRVLGQIRDPWGNIREEIRADHRGRVVMLRGLPRIHAGEGAALITGEA